MARHRPLRVPRRAWFGPGLMAMLLLLVLGMLCLPASEWGTRQLFRLATRVSAGALSVEGVSGTLTGPLEVDTVRMQAGDTHVILTHLALDWHVAAQRLVVPCLQIGRLDIRYRPKSGPIPPPVRLTLPFGLQLPDAEVGAIVINGQTVASALRLALDSDGTTHQLTRLRAHTPWLKADGRLTVSGHAPFALSGAVALEGVAAEHPWHTALALGGRLQALTLRGTASGGPLAGQINARLDPLAASPLAILQDARIELAGLNLQAIDRRAPRTALAAQFLAHPTAQGVALQWQVQNADAGAWPDKRLPIRLFEGKARYQADVLILNAGVLRTPQGDAHFAGPISANTLALSIRLNHFSPKPWGVTGVPVSGQIDLLGTIERPRMNLDLQATPLRLAGTLALDRAKSQLNVERLHLNSGAAGVMQLAGHISHRGVTKLSATLRAFDPGSLSPWLGRPLPNGTLSGRASLTLADKTASRGEAQLSLTNSRLNGQPLAIEAAGRWQGNRLSQLALTSQVGTNRLAAQGALGQPGDALTIMLDAPSLAMLGPGFGGRAEANVTLRGALAHPTIDGRIAAVNLRMTDQLRFEHLSLEARLAAAADRSEDLPLQLDLDWRDAHLGTLHAHRGQVKLVGRRSAHRLTLSAEGELGTRPWSLHAEATGGLTEARWRGRLTQLDADGHWPVQLLAPVHIEASEQGWSLGTLQAAALGARLELDTLRYHADTLQLAGRLQQVNVEKWLGALPMERPPVSGDLTLDARFALDTQPGASSHVTLTRRQGDLKLRRSDGTLLPLKLQDAHLELLREGLSISSRFALRTAEWGELSGELGTRLARITPVPMITPDAPLSGHVRLNVPTLDWAGPLIDLSLVAKGRLDADIQLGGTLAAPRLTGPLRLEDLALRHLDWGSQWQQGSLQARFDGDALAIERFSLKAGEGTVAANGRLGWRGGDAEATLQVRLDRFAALSRPDRQLVVAGHTHARLEAGTLTLEGQLRAERGLWVLPRHVGSALGDDVVVKGATPRTALPHRALPLRLKLDLDLGDHFVFRGQGIDTRLSGGLRLAASPTSPLNASGRIEVVPGTGRYQVYGQQLLIQRGVLTFSGPLDNPALDIFAVRPNLPEGMTVGVEMGGTALAPRVALSATPDMPDNDKLAWLVLGRAPNSATRGDVDLLLAAADTLVSANQSAGLRQELASRLGLDEIGFSSKAGTDNPEAPLGNRVLTLGKRLSDRAYLSYAQGLDGLSHALQLSYQLSRRWRVSLAAGETSAIDLFYTLLFD